MSAIRKKHEGLKVTYVESAKQPNSLQDRMYRRFLFATLPAMTKSPYMRDAGRKKKLKYYVV